jgi:hypothetical protein
MIKPNFLIVGAAKCGTTSVYEYLRGHPEVFMPMMKEPCFFSSAGRIETFDQYLSLFSSVKDEKAIGEASTAYLYDKSTPQQILDYLGKDIKLIILLRNPIDMSRSLWAFMVRNGLETLSFEDAINEEHNRISDPFFRHRAGTWIYQFAYIDRAKYAEQVQRYLQNFTKENLRIYIFEEFFQDISSHYRDLCNFLGINDEYKPKFKIFNPAGKARSKFVQSVIVNRTVWKEKLRPFIPMFFRHWLLRKIIYINIKQDALPEFSRNQRQFLWKFFEEDVRRLEELLGRNLRDTWEPTASE